MKKILFILAAFLFFSSFASAFTSLLVDIDDRGDAIFIGTTVDNLTLPDGISIINGRISGITSSLTSKSGDIWEFSLSIPDSRINLVLPKGAVIKNISEGEITISESQISILSKDEINVQYDIEPVSTNYYTYLIILMVLALVIILVYLIYKNKNKHKQDLVKEKAIKPDKFKIIKRILNEREKTILDNLRKSGKIKMSHLRKLTEIPKASFSRHIQELEKKKLIKRTGEGKNKFVELFH